MTIFQEFRLWARRAPLGERLTALLGAAAAMTLIVWLLVPATANSSSANAGSGGLNRGSAGTGSSGGTTASSDPGAAAGSGFGSGGTSGASPSGSGGTSGASPSGSGGSSGASPSGGASKPGCPSGSDQGVTSSQINVAVILINLVGPASNATVGVPAPQEQQQDFQQVLDSVNAAGGIACRKVAATYYTPNIADQSQLQQTCLQIVQSKPFAAIDLGAFSFFPGLASCLPQNQVPEFSGLTFPATEQAQFYPYWFSLDGVAETFYHNTVLALKQLGFFSAANGFTKLGLAYRDCTPQFLPEVESWLNQVGVPSSQIDAFDDGCPSTAVTPPNVVEQNILSFQQNHVSSVFFLDNVATFESWTAIAQQQGFNPKYGFPDDGEVPISSGNGPFNWQNLNGAIAIESGRYGENTTPGLAPTAGTVACNAIYAKYGRPPVYQQADGIGGVVCNDLTMFAAAVDNAPVVQRNALAAGLQASKSVDFSYPQGPASFVGNRVTYGGEFWRPLKADASCNCWRVTNPTFQPSFP